MPERPLVETVSPGALLEAMSEAVYVVDRDRKITYWNAAAEQLTGYTAEEVVGHRCRDGILCHVDAEGTQLCTTRCPLLSTISDGKTCETSAFLRHRDGHRVPVDIRSAALRSQDGRVTGAVEVFHDDGRTRALAERLDEAQRQALTDPLTGIANRRMLERALHHRDDEYRRYARAYAVLFADIDNFKRVNDTYGHDVGDEVIKLVAATLRDCTRPSDTVGRWGGEEFLLLGPVTDPDDAKALAERIRQVVATAWTTHEGSRVAVTLSIGVALCRPGEQPSEMVKRADLAMLSAKTSGRNRTMVA